MKYTEQQLIEAFLKVYIAPDIDNGDSIFQFFKEVVVKNDVDKLTQALVIILRLGFEDTFKELTGKTVSIKQDGTWELSEVAE